MEERRADYNQLTIEVATLRVEVTGLKTALAEWAKALTEYRGVHITCPFNPERNGEAEEVINAVKDLRDRSISDRSYRRGLLFGLTGLGALQAWDIVGPIVMKGLGGG